MHQSLVRRLAALSIALLSLTSCDRLLATSQAVSLVTSIPSAEEAQGWGEGIGANALVDLFASKIEGMGATAAFVATTRKKSFTSAEMLPLNGARVVVSWPESKVRLCEVSPGTYSALSKGDAADCSVRKTLSYVPGEKYYTEVETDDEVFQLSIVAPPPVAPDLVDFIEPFTANALPDSSLFSLPGHDLGTSLTVNWARDEEAATRKMFITLMRIGYRGTTYTDADLADINHWSFDQKNPVFDNTPREATELLGLLAGGIGAPELTISSEVFASAGIYALILTATSFTTDASANLSIGSGALAGKGTGFIFFVK